MPENVPEGGFRAGDHHLETSSVQCPERVCAVYGLEGDPSDGCTENCASPPEVEERVFCTCRCDSVFDDDDFCDCPSDFTCAPVGEQGDSYCVRDSLVD